jgi:hypothetical protein
MPPTAAPPAPTPPEPPKEPQQTASDRLLRAQAAELEALRARVQGLPDPDEMLSWRSKAQKFDQLAAELPGWREQLQAAHTQERDQLQQQLQQSTASLERARLEHDLQTEFLRSGGNLATFQTWLELYGSKHIQRAADGAFVGTENGQQIPISDVLNSQRDDALFGGFFHPRYGAGAGSRSSRDVAVNNTTDLSKVKTRDLFTSAFTRSK